MKITLQSADPDLQRPISTKNYCRHDNEQPCNSGHISLTVIKDVGDAVN